MTVLATNDDAFCAAAARSFVPTLDMVLVFRFQRVEPEFERKKKKVPFRGRGRWDGQGRGKAVLQLVFIFGARIVEVKLLSSNEPHHRIEDSEFGRPPAPP